MVQTDFLKGVSLFSELSDEELNEISSQSEILSFMRDAEICKEGQKADAMFIIKSGIVQIFCDDGHGGKKILTHLKMGDYFGEMALLTDEPRNASIVSLAETQVIKITKESFNNLLQRTPRVSISIIKTLCERLSKTNIGAAAQTRTHNVYTIMGPDNSSGKSTFARNLALAMQNILKKDVLLFDPNLRDERLARSLGITERSHVIDELVDRERIRDLSKYVVKSPCGLLTILPQENGLTDIRLKEFHTFSFMQTVMEQYEYVVVDSSSLFTKVTKDIVQHCDKIVYLISSKNVSVSGLIEHFDKTRHEWKVSPEKIVYGLNHNTDKKAEESIITDADKKRLCFEIPFCADLKGKHDPESQLLIQTNPDHPFSANIAKEAVSIIYDQAIGICLPTLSSDPARKDMAQRWIESAQNEFAGILNRLAVFQENSCGEPCAIISGFTTKWDLNDHVVRIVDFSNRFKKEFGITAITMLLNGQKSSI